MTYPENNRLPLLTNPSMVWGLSIYIKLGLKGLILIQSKISFECTKSLALECYSQDFTKKNYQVVFEKRSLYFTSHMKISKSKSNNKTPQNTFNSDSIKNSFWVHIDTGIRMLFKESYKKLVVLKNAHFTSSPLSPMKPPKIHLILIQSKILFLYI